MTKGDAIIVVADTHIGSTVGLSPATFYKDDGDPVKLSKVRRWLLKQWENFLNDVDQITEGYERTLVLNGDIAEIDSKYRSWQLLSRNPADVKRAVAEVLDPLAQMCDDIFVLRGTEAHTGKAAYLEEQIADDLEAVKDPISGRYSWWHLRAKWEGVAFDVAHHWGGGYLPWTFANAANKLAVMTGIAYSEWGEKPPQVAIRAHKHRFGDSGRTFPTRAVLCPSWQMKTAYVHRIGSPNSFPDIGGLIFLCKDGNYQFHDLRYKPKRRRAWTKK
jgi:hypothetical protein